MFAGSSFTANGTIGYRPQANQWCLLNYPVYSFSFPSIAINGHNTWSNLVRLSDGGNVFVIDYANDAIPDLMEAMILRLWSMNPLTKIIIVSSPSWLTKNINDDGQVNTPYNQTVLGQIQSLASYYGIAFADYWDWCKSVVSGTYHLNQLVSGDTVHPTQLGYNEIASLVEAYLPNGGGSMPSVLPSRVYPASADYQQLPTVKNGISYDSRSGTWADNGNSTSSSTAGSIITYSGVFRSYGCYRADGLSNTVLVSVDGGAYNPGLFYQNGVDIGLRAAHTIRIQVPPSGTVTIDQFWAI